MNWAIYDPTTGRIRMVRRRSSAVPPRTGALSRIVVADSVHPDNHYIDGGIVRERPELTVSVDWTGDDLTIAGLPPRAEVLVEGADQVEKGRYRIRRGDERHLFVKAFPYKDFHQNLAPGLDQREADLTQISDPIIREFLRKYVR